VNERAPSVGRFVLAVFLWLPVCFAAGYVAAKPHAAIAGRLAWVLVDMLSSGLISAIEQPATDLVYVTRLAVTTPAGEHAVLVAEVDPFVYTFGLPLFVALMLASRARIWKILAGAAALLPFQAWGIGFDVLAKLGTQMGPAIAAQVGFSRGGLEAIALGYQVGSLLLPTLMPVVLWAAFCRQQLGMLAPALARTAALSPRDRSGPAAPPPPSDAGLPPGRP
jgi:hypothetical protein